MGNNKKIKNIYIYIVIGIGLIISVCCILVYAYSIYKLPTEEEKNAVIKVQNWEIYGMTCKSWIELTALPYVEYGNADIMWSATKEDNKGNYIVTSRIYSPKSDVKFKWRINLKNNNIIPLDENTICPPPSN